MGGKLAATLFALVFAIPFGAVGLFAAWAIASMARESVRSADWVVVQATVQSAELRASRSRKSTTYEATGAFRYLFGGKDYTGTQLGLSAFGGADNLGDWQQDMGEFLQDALEKRRTVSVYVNPDNPSEAVVDRGLRWGVVAFLSAFAVLFGGVGVGALAVIVGIWTGKPETRDARARQKRAGKQPVRFATHPARPVKPIDPELEKIFGAGTGLKLDEDQRKLLSELTPEQQRLVGKAVKAGSLIRKAMAAVWFLFVALTAVVILVFWGMS